MIDIILEEYKDITERLIKNISNDVEVLELMEKREKLINDLFNKHKNKETIRSLYLSKGLLYLDKELKELILNEKNNIKEEIKNLHKIKNANKVYEKNRNTNSFFSRKI